MEGTGKILVDVREPNRYIGRRELLDLKAGHIPGAVNLPLARLMHSDHTYRSPGSIRRAFASVGVDNPEDAIIYSGSGLHSAAAIAAMHLAGIPGAAHYVGGWSQWAAHHDNPVDRVI